MADNKDAELDAKKDSLRNLMGKRPPVNPGGLSDLNKPPTTTAPPVATPETDTHIPAGRDDKPSNNNDPAPKPATATTAKARRSKPKKTPKTTKPKRSEPPSSRTYPVRVPINLDAAVERYLAAREDKPSLSYIVRVAFATHHNNIEAPEELSKEAALLAAAGLGTTPKPAPLGDHKVRHITTTPATRAAFETRAAELQISVPELIRRVLEQEVNPNQPKPD